MGETGMKPRGVAVARLLNGVWWGLAGLLFFSMPVTSFPLVARLTGSSMVAPLALLPLAGLLAWWPRRGTAAGQGRAGPPPPLAAEQAAAP